MSDMPPAIPNIVGDDLESGMPFTAAVLAGGRSSRMGADKSFLAVGNELLMERQLRCLRHTGASEVLISGRSGADYARFGSRVIYDQQTDRGPLAGIASLLRAVSSSILLVLAVDMPAMTPAMLRKIISACDESRGCVPVDDRGLQPLAAAYPKAALALAEHQLETGRYSMEAFVREAVDAGFIRLLPIETGEGPLFANWNRPNDWTPLQP